MILILFVFQVSFTCDRLQFPCYSYTIKLQRQQGDVEAGLSREDFEEKTKAIRFRMYQQVARKMNCTCVIRAVALYFIHLSIAWLVFFLLRISKVDIHKPGLAVVELPLTKLASAVLERDKRTDFSENPHLL